MLPSVLFCEWVVTHAVLSSSEGMAPQLLDDAPWKQKSQADHCVVCEPRFGQGFGQCLRLSLAWSCCFADSIRLDFNRAVHVLGQGAVGEGCKGQKNKDQDNPCLPQPLPKTFT